MAQVDEVTQLPAEQVFPEAHDEHTAPLFPQADVVCCEVERQVFPWQQPLGQFAGEQLALLEQTPPEQEFPALQARHTSPPEPHVAALCWVKSMHAPLEQHPLQLATLQPEEPPEPPLVVPPPEPPLPPEPPAPPA